MKEIETYFNQVLPLLFCSHVITTAIQKPITYWHTNFLCSFTLKNVQPQPRLLNAKVWVLILSSEMVGNQWHFANLNDCIIFPVQLINIPIYLFTVSPAKLIDTLRDSQNVIIGSYHQWLVLYCSGRAALRKLFSRNKTVQAAKLVFTGM